MCERAEKEKEKRQKYRRPAGQSRSGTNEDDKPHERENYFKLLGGGRAHTATC